MFYEYALEPALLSNWASFRYFTEKFGWAHGRLIVEHPKKWRKMVYECLECHGREKLRIVEKMRSISDRTIRRRDASYDPATDWLGNALSEHARQPFFAILASENPGQAADVILGDDADEANLAAPTGIVCRRPKDLAGAISLLVRTARRVVLADPYFAPDKARFRAVLEAIVDAAGPGTEFVIHTSIDRHFDLDEQRKTEVEDRVTANLRRLFEARPFTSMLPDWCTVQVCIGSGAQVETDSIIGTSSRSSAGSSSEPASTRRKLARTRPMI